MIHFASDHFAPGYFITAFILQRVHRIRTLYKCTRLQRGSPDTDRSYARSARSIPPRFSICLLPVPQSRLSFLPAFRPSFLLASRASQLRRRSAFPDFPNPFLLIHSSLSRYPRLRGILDKTVAVLPHFQGISADLHDFSRRRQRAERLKARPANGEAHQPFHPIRVQLASVPRCHAPAFLC